MIFLKLFLIVFSFFINYISDLDKLEKLGEIKKVVVSTYQSVSGAGSKALDDLNNKTRLVFKKGIEISFVL